MNQNKIRSMLIFCFLFPGIGFAVVSPPIDILLEETIKPSVAISDFDRPLPLSPANSPYLQGLRFLGTGNVDSALEAFNKALEMDARHIPTLMALTDIAFRQNRIEEAAKRTQTSIQISPQDYRLRLVYGQILAAQNKISEPV